MYVQTIQHRNLMLFLVGKTKAKNQKAIHPLKQHPQINSS